MHFKKFQMTWVFEPKPFKMGYENREGFFDSFQYGKNYEWLRATCK